MLSYLATPYTSNNPMVMQRRFEDVTQLTGLLMKSGSLIYSPITHCHQIAQLSDMPVNFSFWSRHCLAMLSKCDELLVFTADGWEDSTGIGAEIDFAKEHNIPIRYVTYYFDDQGYSITSHP